MRAAGWLLLAFCGQAAALHLVQAGPEVGYQHYPPAGRLLQGWNLLATGVLAAQAALVTLGLRGHMGGVASWLRRHYRPVALVALVATFAFTAAAPSRDLLFFAFELVFAAGVQAIALGTVFLAVSRLPPTLARRASGGLERLLETSGRVRVDRFALGAAAFVVVAAAALAVLAYERHPHVPDEVAYLYHARYLAAGELTMPEPPTRGGFDVDLMSYEGGRWYSPVPPGWPAVLAAGVRVGAPWLVNPVLGGLGVVFFYLLVGRLYDGRTARLATLLLCASPWYLFMSMSYMNHPLILTAALGAGVAALRLRRDGGGLAMAAAGVGIGIVALTRPLDGLIVAGVLGLGVLIGAGWGRRLVPVAGMGIVSAGVAALVLPYNRALTGDPVTFPIMAYMDRTYGPGSNALGFGPERGVGWTGLDPFPGHGLPDVLVNAHLNGFAFNVELFGWAGGSLILLLLYALSGPRERRDRFLMVAAGAVVLALSFYWFAGGPDFGARYWYLAVPPAVALTARGCRWMSRRVGGADGRVLLFVACLCLLSLSLFVPWRAADKYHRYRGMGPAVRQLAERPDLRGALVLVRGHRHPDYASAAIYNPLDLRSEAPVFAWDRNEEVRRVILDAYPDREVWVLEGPTVTGGDYRLRGPVDVRADAAGPERGR